MDLARSQENDPTIEKAEPGNLWSVGAKPRNWIPHLKLGKDIPYEMAGELDGGACLYHRDTMEPMDINKIIMDDTKDECVFGPSKCDAESFERGETLSRVQRCYTHTGVFGPARTSHTEFSLFADGF